MLVEGAGHSVTVGPHYVTFTGAGTLNLGGDFDYTSGTFTPGTSTVNYTGSGAQSVGSVTYHQLTFNKTSGTASLPGAATVNGNLTVTITSDPVISQPAPFSQGRTVVTESADVQLKQDGSGFVGLSAGAKLADVVKALNSLGATPADLLAILQAMRSAGALKAELEII